MQIVTDFVEGRSRDHVLVAGGFGTGKSRAVGVAAVAAAVSGARVARLEQGPVGISSFDDFLAAVNDAASGSEIRLAPGSGARSLSDGGAPLVIIVEGLDQLIRQIRAADRPAFGEMLAASDGPLVVGTTIIGALPKELAASFQLFRTSPVPSAADGIRIAIEAALRHRLLVPSTAAELERESRHIELALLGNQLLWALAAGHLATGADAPLVHAERELRALMKAHFSALLLRVAPSEQRVLLEIARAGAPRTVQEIAEATDVRNQAAASALARLHADGWVVTIPAPVGADRRRTWYDIADPLLRVHLRPRGEGSVSDLIRSLVDVWQETGVVAASVPMTLPSASDAEAIRRGGAGEPEVARAWFEEMFLQRAEAYGLKARSTLDTFWALAVWTGNAGDPVRAQRMLSVAISDLDDLAGVDSREGIRARSHAAAILVELGELDEAARRYAEVHDLAAAAGERDLVARATQDIGRVLGEQGRAAEAVERIAAAVADLSAAIAASKDAEQETWRRRLRRAQRELAFWTARAGDADRGREMLDELIAAEDATASERHRLTFERIGILALDEPIRALQQYDQLAVEIEGSGSDAELVRTVRRTAFELAVSVWPKTPGVWPVHAVPIDVLEDAVVALVVAGGLTVQGLATVLVQVGGADVRILAARLVGAHVPLPQGQRSAIARTILPHLRRAAEQRLFSDLALALEGDPAGEANLPEEWRQIIDAVRDLDLQSR